MPITPVASNAPYPLKASYTSLGEELFIQFAGSGYRPSSAGAGLITVNLFLDDKQVATGSVFTNNDEAHAAFVPVAVLLTNIPPGQHTFTVQQGTDTVVDNCDRFTISVFEFGMG